MAVPSGFYKIVADLSVPESPEVLAFFFPHQDVTGNVPKVQVESVLESVDEIERMTGLDFLSALPDEVERPIGAIAATALWHPLAI